MPPITRARTPLTKRQRFQQLIDAGIKTDSGNEFSLSACARTAGLAKGTIYHHFNSSEDYYLSVLEAATAALTRELSGDRWSSMQASHLPRLLSLMAQVSDDGRHRAAHVVASLETWLAESATPPVSNHPNVALAVGNYLLLRATKAAL